MRNTFVLWLTLAVLGVGACGDNDTNSDGDAKTKSCPGANADACCPLTQSSTTVVLEVTSSVTVHTEPAGSETKLFYILFSKWPPDGPPRSSKVVSAADETLSFPMTLIDTYAPAGDTVMYVCQDATGDDVRNTAGGCDDADDAFVLYPASGSFNLLAGKVVLVKVNLDAKTIGITDASDAGSYGCN